MSREALQKLLQSAHDLQEFLKPTTKAQRGVVPPTPELSIVMPTPLQEHLHKLGLCKDSAAKLNRIYVDAATDYRSKAAAELRLLWKNLYEDGAYQPEQTWHRMHDLVQKNARGVLRDIFERFCAITREHIKVLGSRKRKSQPVFDQKIVNFLIWFFAQPDKQTPNKDDKKELARRTGLTLKQIDIWFQNRRARTKRKMANSGVTDIKEALGNPERPSFTTLPGPMRAMLEKNAEQKKELAKLKRAAERRERREKEKSKRVKVELKRRWIREENEPPVDWLCPRAQAEKATRDKLKSGKLRGIDSWSAPAYAYPAEWSQKARDAWWKIDFPCVSEFEHKSTPHPDEPKDVTVTDEEMDALEKQFDGLKIKALKKIYLHQHSENCIEIIHPKLVRVRKDGSFFMFDDDEPQDSPKPTPAPLAARSTQSTCGDSASCPIIVDQLGTVPSGPAAPSAPPQAVNPIVIVSIPEVEMASGVKVKPDASKGKGRMPPHKGTSESDSGSSRASSSPGASFSPFTASFAMPAPSSLAVGGAAVTNELDMFVAQLGFPPSSSSLYPYEDVQSSLPPGIFDVPEPGSVPAAVPAPDPPIMPATAGSPADYLPANSGPPEVPTIDPVQTRQSRTLEEELAEFFESIKTYNPPQAQTLPQSDNGWSALFAPEAAAVYQPIPDVPGATVPASVPQAQIVVESQLDPLVQMQTGPLDTWAALYGADTYLALPRMEDIPPPSAWEGAFDPTLQAFLDQLWTSDIASDATAPPVADPSAAFEALPSQGFDFFNFV